ncbi:MAG: hypothetical protein JWQ22_2361 [Devosia sp.]|nr:hypothetical protein [Devosia sp.]
MSASTSLSTAPSRVVQIADWVLRGLIAAAFVASGGAKFAGAEQMVVLFDQIGMGQGLRYLVGLIEVIGAILIIVPRTALPGAALLAITMAGAVFTHLVLIGGSPLPALVLLAFNAVVLWMRRADLRRFLP